MNLINEINQRVLRKEKMWAVLIDPDKTNISDIPELCYAINKSSCDYVLVGGSLMIKDVFELCIITLRKHLRRKIIIFPGNNLQISSEADAILLLSLISGRNAELLIGQHIQTSFQLKKSALEILSCGYLIIESDEITSVQYMSNTIPIPKNKTDIGAATALAGEQLGLKFMYIDAGSGANKPININMISAIKRTISTPLFVGGGISKQEDLEKAWQNGADIVVIGTAIENDKQLILDIIPYNNSVCT